MKGCLQQAIRYSKNAHNDIGIDTITSKVTPSQTRTAIIKTLKSIIQVLGKCVHNCILVVMIKLPRHFNDDGRISASHEMMTNISLQTFSHLLGMTINHETTSAVFICNQRSISPSDGKKCSHMRKILPRLGRFPVQLKTRVAVQLLPYGNACLNFRGKAV